MDAWDGWNGDFSDDIFFAGSYLLRLFLFVGAGLIDWILRVGEAGWREVTMTATWQCVAAWTGG